MLEGGICLITFSNNSDHQTLVYSLYDAINEKVDAYTFGIKNPKCLNYSNSSHNFYFDCPLRPGITKGTFNFRVLFEMASIIKRNRIKYVYFESVHLWNIFLMLLLPKCVKIVSIHDIKTCDNNRALQFCNFVSCKIANKILIHNEKYFELFLEMYNVQKSKVKYMPLWKNFPKRKEPVYNKKMLCFGRIRKYKGYDLLKEIAKKTPQIQYQVVGASDKDNIDTAKGLKKLPNIMVEDREVTEREMESYFNNCDWVILPYSSATQSGVILDAYRFSRPVIAFNVGALSEQIEDKKTGFLIPEKNMEMFADCIKKVTNFTNTETEAFSHRAYDYGYKKYAAESVSESFLNAIEC